MQVLPTGMVFFPTGGMLRQNVGSAGLFGKTFTGKCPARRAVRQITVGDKC
jgi:hypothetical protein